MKNNKLIIKPDDYCFGQDFCGESRCDNLDNEDKCTDIKECFECKKRRVEEILKTIITEEEQK